MLIRRVGWLITSTMVACWLSTTAIASQSSVILTGRYQAVANAPTSPQARLLKQRKQIHFGSDVVKIGDAINHWLQFSGYHCVPKLLMSLPVQQLLMLPLPEIDRDFGPMSLLQGLQALVGSICHILIDPVHRLVSFEIKKPYRAIYTSPSQNWQQAARESKNNK